MENDDDIVLGVDSRKKDILAVALLAFIYHDKGGKFSFPFDKMTSLIDIPISIGIFRDEDDFLIVTVERNDEDGKS